MTGESGRVISALPGGRPFGDRSGVLDELGQRLEERGPGWLEVHLPSLVRRLGRDQPWTQARLPVRQGVVDARRLRLCDAAAAVLLDRAMELGTGAPWLVQLYSRGDAEERRMILRSLPFVEADEVAPVLMEEAHRTNDQVIFEAGLLDSDLPALLLDGDAYRRAVLRTAFLDLRAARLLGLERRADPELSRMLLEFMSEREAADRPVWPDTLPVCALAPVAGVVPKVAGDLWHGRDVRRRQAARAAARLQDPWLADRIRERLEVERDPVVRELLEATP